MLWLKFDAPTSPKIILYPLSYLKFKKKIDCSVKMNENDSIHEIDANKNKAKHKSFCTTKLGAKVVPRRNFFDDTTILYRGR
jgi:hypothetical protein